MKQSQHQPFAKCTPMLSQSLEPVRLDRKLLENLLRQYYEELRFAAYKKIRSRDQATDVVQDAIVRILAADGQGAGLFVSNPQRFLHRVVSNLSLDRLRQERRRGPHTSIETVADLVADPAPLAERTLSARQEYEILRRTLDALPPRCREALLLNRIDGLSHARIAQRFGVSPTAVAKYIASALKHCFAALAEVS